MRSGKLALCPGTNCSGRGIPRRTRAPNVALLTRAVGSGEVTHVQVAVGGRWEEAARVNAPGGAGSLAELTRLLPVWGESAVEVFAKDARGCVAFVGVRFVNRARTEVEDVLRDLCEIAFSKDGTLLRVASWLSATIGAPLFESECSSIEVGVVDAWKSFGAVRLTPVSGRRRSEAKAVLLDAAGRLSAPPNRVIAAEFACDTPVAHWVAVEIARSDETGVIVPSASVRTTASYLAALGSS